jgi:hypothetical protein
MIRQGLTIQSLSGVSGAAIWRPEDFAKVTAAIAEALPSGDVATIATAVIRAFGGAQGVLWPRGSIAIDAAVVTVYVECVKDEQAALPDWI